MGSSLGSGSSERIGTGAASLLSITWGTTKSLIAFSTGVEISGGISGSAGIASGGATVAGAIAASLGAGTGAVGGSESCVVFSEVVLRVRRRKGSADRVGAAATISRLGAVWRVA